MPRMNDDSINLFDWTNRKLIAELRRHIAAKTDPTEPHLTNLIDEIERRFVRSSSRGG